MATDVRATSRQAKLLLGFTALAVVLLRLSLLSTPTLRDEGLYGYIAQDVLRGYLPLETAMDNKGPALFYEWALALLVFGFSSIEGVRVLGIVFVIGSLATLFVLARELKGERVAVIAVMLMAFHTSLVEMDGYYYASEFYTLLPLILSALLAWRGARSATAWPSFLAGIFLSLAVWTRLTALTLAPWLGLFIVFGSSKETRWKRALALTGGALGLSGCFLALYQSRGQLPLLIEAWVTFPAVQVVTRNAFVSEFEQLLNIGRQCLPQTILLWLPVTASLLFLDFDLKTREGRFLGGWLAMAALGFWLPRLYFAKQLFLVFPPLCILAAAKLDEWARSSRKGVVILAASCLIFTIGWNAPKHLALMRGDPAASELIFSKGEKTAAWIRANTTPEDFVYNWGVEWEIYFRSERRAPTRQLNTLVFVVFALAVESGAPFAEDFDKLQQQVISGLQAHPPKIIAQTSGTKNYDLKSFYLAGYVESMLKTDYELLFHDEPYWVFRRKPEAQKKD
jgi:4-amino-4-deoxy-L-arabinose transferase-like glycosyltransferase